MSDSSPITIDHVDVKVLPGDLVASAAAVGPLWREFGYKILAASKADSPVGPGRNRTGGGGSGQSLRGSLNVRFEFGDDPRIGIYSAKTVGDKNYSLLDIVVSGTPPHPIDPVTAKVLRFKSKGTVVFAGHVNHPGTKANPFVQKAMVAITNEAGGITA